MSSIPAGLAKVAYTSAVSTARAHAGDVHPRDVTTSIRAKYDPEHWYDWADWYFLARRAVYAVRAARAITERYGQPKPISRAEYETARGNA